jgi:NAD dependent epimerase/dehydratase family enzyme
MYIHAISNENISGVYNGVAPTPLSYIDLINAVSDAMGKRKINAPVPLWLLLLLKGDFVKSLVSSAKCSSKKITDTGFVFEFPTLKQALHDLLKK